MSAESVELSREELVGQIRFALSELSSDNAHQRFEDLCRNFARERLVPNILPATGPVGVGGDQGRDFETFRSYMREELGPHGAFAGALKDGAVAFACTIQQENLPAKIRSDVEKIVSSGTTVTMIYAFLTAPLPVSNRHQIQEEVRGEHGVELEVFDGPGLADALADRHVFWIAEEFLSFPATFRPADVETMDELPKWYLECRDRWRKQARLGASLGELSSVIEGLRHATFSSEARSDLPFWLDLVRPLALNLDAPSDHRQRARYEVAVAEIRGGGSLRPADEIAWAFLRECLSANDPAILSDAAALLSYAGTAVSFGHSDLDRGQLAEINTTLRAQVTEFLEADPPPIRRARLLMVLGHLSLIPDPRELGSIDPAKEELPNAAKMIDQATEEGIPDQVVASLPAVDLEGAMQAWRTLASVLEQTPLFPVESWSRQLEFLAPLLVTQEGWEEIENAVDDALQRLHGGDAAASRARDRAVRLQDAGRLRDALAEFHKAKMRWWNGDSLRGALLCMLAISEIYRDLQLPLAGKQYAFAVAGAANSGDDEVQDLVAVAIMKASEMDYAAGAWASAVELVDVGLLAHAALDDAETNPWMDHDFQNAVMTVGMALRAARAFCPQATTLIEDVARRHGMLEPLEKTLAEAGDWDTETWTKASDEQHHGRPFSDLGAERTIAFSALGTEWRITTPNGFRESRAAERLAASAQLLLVELADDDLCLLRSSIEISVELIDDRSNRADPRLSVGADGIRRWTVQLAALRPNGNAAEVEASLSETLAVLSAVLLDVSLLPTAEYFEATNRAFERGLGHKLAIGRPYEEMAELVPESRFDTSAREAEAPFADGAPSPPEHPELSWQTGPGPTYDKATARQMLANRYKRLPKLIPATLARLRKDDTFRGVVADLRAKGWLDWHLLTALTNIALNMRLSEQGLNTRQALEDPGARAKVQELTKTPETAEDAPIPDAKLSTEELDLARMFGIPSLIHNWDLDARGPMLGPGAFEELLAERYGYWSDDIAHDDPFSPLT